MTAMSNAPIELGKPEPFYQIWLKALTQPVEKTFSEIAASPHAKQGTAYLWLFLAGLVNSIVTLGLQGVTMRRLQEYIPPEAANIFGPAQISGTGLVGVICGAPITALFGVLFFAVGVALIQWIAKMFGGSGDFNRMVYTFACIAAPLNLVSAVLSLFAAIPFVGILFGLVSFVVAIYGLFLSVLAVKAVNQFGWGAALGSVLLPWAVFICLCACVIIVSLAILGPMIGNVFSTINQSLGTY
jgi:hypothetical protein